MRIAIVGTRGIPANYGGFETFAEELSRRLVARGHRVTVYGRSHHVPRGMREHRGVDLVVLPTIRQKYLDTVVHTGLCALHALFCRYDAILICNAANALFALPLRLRGLRVAINVDGIERLRKKWNALGRLWYRLGERLAARLPHAVVSDAQVIRDYYLERYRVESVFIPYGGDLERPETTEALDRYGLKPRRYLLYVSRLEPENNAHVVLEAYARVQTPLPLVMVGDAPYSRDYIARLREMADPRVVFTGYVFGRGYRELQSHAYCYIHATEVGGTHPALVEAMGTGGCVLVNGTPENLEVVGEAGVIYRKNDPTDLAAQLQAILNDPERAEGLRALAAARVRERYSWDAVTDAYEALFTRLSGRSVSR